MTYIDYSILLVFLVCMFLIGYGLSRWIKSADDFMVAGRHITPFILAAALTAANVNLYSFIGQSGSAYKYGISIIWHTWTGNMALVFSGLFVIPILRRLKIRTVPEFVGMRYNVWIRFLLGGIWVVRLSFWLGVVLYTAALAFQTIAGVDYFPITRNFTFWLFIFAGIAIAYTFLGGMWSVTITDVIQFILMLGGALIVLPIVMQLVGWWPGLVEKVAAGHLNLVPSEGIYDWKFVLALWLIGIQWASCDQGLLQMSFSSKDAKTAAKGLVLAGIITTPFALLWILPGLAASILYPGLQNLDSAFPTLIQHTLPPVVIGLVACGLLSSQMSTISTNLEGVATLFANDIYKAVLNRQATPEQSLWVVRIMTFVAGLLGITFAYLIPKMGGAVQAYLTAVSIMDMPFFVIAILYGLLWKRTNWQGAFIGYLAGAIAGVMGNFVLHLGFNISTFISAGAALAVTPLATVLFREKKNEYLDIIWQAKKHSVTDEGDPYHIIPTSGKGKFFLGVFFLGMALFLIGAFSGAVAFQYAGLVTLIGMVIYFIGGLMRLFFD